MGWGTTAYRYPGTPCTSAVAFPITTNWSVHTTAAGTPHFSISMPSCTLHELHDPQSPTAVMMASHRPTRSDRIPSGQILLAVGLRARTTPAR